MEIRKEVLNTSYLQAQRLKKELAAARAESGISPLPSDVSRTPPARIDGGDLRRETLAFVGEFHFRNCLLVSIQNVKFVPWF